MSRHISPGKATHYDYLFSGKGVFMKKLCILLTIALFLPVSALAAETAELRIIPDEVVRGNSITFDIIGVESTFSLASTLSFEPPGYISVNNLYLLEPTRLMAETDISPDAPVGSYTLTVTTDGQLAHGTIEVTEGTSSTTTTAPPEETCPTIAIYGEDSEEVKMLRLLRDNLLIKTPEGQELIKAYYHWGPALVQAMQEDKACKMAIKEIVEAILPLVAAAPE
jgi:hypothetical protein